MLDFTETTIIQTQDKQVKIWTLAELLDSPDPLSGEPLDERNKAMRKVVEMATEYYSELSETALLRYEFWKQLQTPRIPTQKFEYTTKITNTYEWELTINSSGLFYKDISGQYNAMRGTVSQQLFSQFFFYGPMMPLPDLNIRKQLVALIRNAFMQVGPIGYKHFELFEYPKQPVSQLQWNMGNHVASDYVIVRDYGIETGATNWHDGLVYSSFLSFENFLTLPTAENSLISPEIRSEIEKFLVREPIPTRPKDQDMADFKAESKRLFMNNGGQVHYIYLDGDGDKYFATAQEEAAWRVELIEHYKHRLTEEDHYGILEHIARSLKANGVENVSDIIFEAAKKANPNVKQALSKLLVEKYDAEEGALTLISLLETKTETEYWQNYVFNEFTNMRKQRSVLNFIIQNLRGDDEILFKKAVDVLRNWGMKGDQALSDKNLLSDLNWDDACANDPSFREAIQNLEKYLF